MSQDPGNKNNHIRHDVKEATEAKREAETAAKAAEAAAEKASVASDIGKPPEEITIWARLAEEKAQEAKAAAERASAAAREAAGAKDAIKAKEAAEKAAAAAGQAAEAANEAKKQADARHAAENELEIKRFFEEHKGQIYEKLKDCDKFALQAGPQSDMIFVAESLPIINGIIHVGSTRQRLTEANKWVRETWGESADPLIILSALVFVYVVEEGAKQFKGTAEQPVWDRIQGRVKKLLP
jgi:hypothetical protein